MPYPDKLDHESWPDGQFDSRKLSLIIDELAAIRITAGMTHDQLVKLNDHMEKLTAVQQRGNDLAAGGAIDLREPDVPAMKAAAKATQNKKK